MQAEALLDRLELIYGWYAGMVNPDTGMLEYLYLPSSDRFIRDRSPIRDIASIWDVELVGAVLDRHDLDALVRRSLEHYTSYLTDRQGSLILDAALLGEPSSIAHSAFMLLALLHAPPRGDLAHVARLADGIVRQQRRDGSFKVYFGAFADSGEELYAGEAMLALIESHGRLHDERYLESVERAADYYDARYFAAGRVHEDTLVFFANWQSQGSRGLYESTGDSDVKRRLVDYLGRLHDRIIARQFYEEVSRRPESQSAVEVACAVEGLNDAYAVMLNARDGRAEQYERCVRTGVDYLLRLQCTRGGGPRERGGFGMSLGDRTQRIDVTGHAANALRKTLENLTPKVYGEAFLP